MNVRYASVRSQGIPIHVCRMAMRFVENALLNYTSKNTILSIF